MAELFASKSYVDELKAELAEVKSPGAKPTARDFKQQCEQWERPCFSPR